MKTNTIGESLYQLITKVVYESDDIYSAGCIHHLADGRIRVLFFKYQNGRGLIGMAKPTPEIVRQLKMHAADLKEFVMQNDERHCRTPPWLGPQPDRTNQLGNCRTERR